MLLTWDGEMPFGVDENYFCNADMNMLSFFCVLAYSRIKKGAVGFIPIFPAAGAGNSSR